MASRDEIIRFVFEVTGSNEIAAAVKVMLEAGDAGGEAGAALSAFVDELTKVQGQLSAIRQAISLKAELQDLANQFQAAQERARTLSDSIGRAGASSDEVRKAFKATDAEVARLTEQYQKQDVALQRVLGGLAKAGVDTSNLAKANQDLREKADGVAEKIRTTSTAAQAAGKNLKDAGDGTRKLGDEAKRSGGLVEELKNNLGKIVSVAAAVKLALAGIRFGVEGFKQAADLEESLSRVQALAGEAQQNIAAFESGVGDAAEQAGVSANMAAAAMAALVQQGRSVNEAMTALVPTLLLAKTAQLDVAQAAQIVDGVLSQFGASAADAGRFVDILVAASKGSKDGLQGLADGIGKVAPLARELNLSFQDTVGILGFMTRNGLSAGDATKGLAAIFRDLADPASTLRQELFALGDSTNSFDQAIQTLASSGDRGKEAMLKLDDSTRKVLLFLSQQGVAGLEAFRASLGNVEGAASALDKALSDNLKGAFDDFSRAFDTIGAKLAQPVLDPLKKELQSLAERLNAFAKSPAFDELQAQIGELARNGVEALDTLLKGIDWSSFVAGARAALTDASASIASFKDDLKSVADALNLVANIVGVVYRAVAVTFDAARVAIGAIVQGGAGALAELSTGMDKLTGSTSEATIALESIRDAAGDAAKSGFEDMLRNTDKLRGNFIGLVAEGDKASAGLQVAAAGARIARVAFDNVAAGVESTRAALQHFDVPPGTFDNVISGADSSARALGDMASRVRDAQRAVSSAQAELDRLARTGQTNTSAFRQASAAFDEANARLAAMQGRASTAAGSADELRAALAALGVTAHQDLAQGAATAANALDAVFSAYQKGAASIEDVRAAFESYAAKQNEAVKNSEIWKQQEVKAALEVKRAMLGLSEIKPSPDFSESASGAKDLEKQAEKTGEAVKQVGDKGAEGAKEISDGFAELSGIYSGWTSKFEETSKSAALRFQELTQSIQQFGVSSNVYVQADIIGLARLGEAISKASAQTKAEIDEQKLRVAELTAQYASMSAAALEAQAAQAGGAEALAKSFEAQAAAARNGESQLGLLGAADLSPLASALEGIAARTRQIAAEALASRQQFAAMAADFRQQIAQQQGDNVKAEQLRFEAQLEAMRRQAQEQGSLNSAEYAEAVAQATQLHNIKLQQLKEQAAAAKKSAEEAAAAQAAAEKQKQGGAGSPTTQPDAPAKREIEVTLTGTQLGSIDPNDAKSIQRLAQALLPEMMRQIKAAALAIPRGRGR